MNTETEHDPSTGQEWIDRMGDLEDQHGPVGAGGMAFRLGEV